METALYKIEVSQREHFSLAHFFLCFVCIWQPDRPQYAESLSASLAAYAQYAIERAPLAGKTAFNVSPLSPAYMAPVIRELNKNSEFEQDTPLQASLPILFCPISI